MTGGSGDARSPRDGRNSVDAAWDELIGESDEDHGDSGRGDARPVTGSHAAAAGRPDADDEMARLMGGETPKLPTLPPDTAELKLDVPEDLDAQEPKVGAREEPIVAASKPEVARAPSVAGPPEREAARASVVAPPKAVGTEQARSDAPPKAAVVREEAAPQARSSRPSLRVVEVVPAPASTSRGDDRAARASRPAEPAPAVDDAEPTRSVPWAWIGLGALALGAVAYFATREDTPSSGRERAPAAPAVERTPQEPVQADPDASRPTPAEATAGDAGSDDGAADSGDTGEAKPPTPRSKDPREPPPGTPPEIAAVFRRLPVGPADRPPVGGIGATGIHVDHIAMGVETPGAMCRGRSNDFSVSAGDRPGVCVRVVHPREKEELQVLWQKHGGSTRRSKMVVLPMHAYRTRGYLVLRNEYIGDWTVRILSSDGVELARHDFTVVP
jgi:hypothetical protein